MIKRVNFSSFITGKCEQLKRLDYAKISHHIITKCMNIWNSDSIRSFTAFRVLEQSFTAFGIENASIKLA